MRSPIKKMFSFLFLAFFLTVLLNLVPTLSVFAQGNLIDGQVGMEEAKGVFGEPDDIRVTVAKIINVVLSVLAVVFLILIVVAGFKYMTSAGNEERVKDSVKQIRQAIIGLIIILMAWGITRFVLIRLLAVTSGQNYLFF
jgi:phosphatidylglycerophosphatase A